MSDDPIERLNYYDLSIRLQAIEESHQRLMNIYAKSVAHSVALRDALLSIAEHCQMDAQKLLEYIENLEKKKYDEVLLSLERILPDKAAEIDERKIEDVPVDD